MGFKTLKIDIKEVYIVTSELDVQGLQDISQLLICDLKYNYVLLSGYMI